MSFTLVTGANGFLGGHVTSGLVRRGDRVRAAILPGSPRGPLEELGVEIVEADVRDAEACRRAAEGATGVIHVAGMAREWDLDRRLIYEVNVRGTRNVCRAALEAGARRLVYTSTAMAVGSAGESERADEETIFDLGGAGHYALSKLLAEKEVFEAGAKGLGVNVICPHQLLGPGDLQVTTLNGFILRFVEGRLPAVVDTLIQPVDVRDVAAAHVSALDVEVAGERFVVAGDEVLSVRAFFEALAPHVGRGAPRLALPPSLLRAASKPLTFVADHITRRPPLVPASNASVLSKRMAFDCEKAKRTLGFRPRPWLESALDSIAFYQTER